jgi:DNA-binding NarL/FixJ family response regulator
MKGSRLGAWPSFLGRAARLHVKSLKINCLCASSESLPAERRTEGPTNLMPRVIVADDHPAMLAAMVSLLQADCDIVATATNGADAVEQARRLSPDIVVLDITMPVLDGLGAARQIKSQLPDTKVIFVTIHEEPDIAAEARRLGATGYILKRAAASELLNAVKAAMEGRTYFGWPSGRSVDRNDSEPGGSDTDG